MRHSFPMSFHLETAVVTCPSEYLFDFSVNEDGSKLVISDSSNSLNILDSTTLQLQSKISAHSDTINDIECSKASPFLIYSASSDGNVCLWDMRQADKAALRFKIPDEVYTLSVSYSDTLLTTAYDSSILFFDLRRSGGVGDDSSSSYKTHKHKLGEYSDMHSDLITQLEFNPSNPVRGDAALRNRSH